MHRRPWTSVSGLLASAVLVVCATFLMAMGDMGGKTSSKMPTPTKNFHASITDTGGVVSEAELVSCDGKTRLTGYRGKTKVDVPFSKIQSAVVKDLDNRYKQVELTFWDGTQYEYQVKSYSYCQGRTSFGDVTVKIRDIKNVEFEKGEYSETGEAESESKTE